jgi:hypothetical protein
VNDRTGRDPEKADPGFAAVVRLPIGLEDSATHPEAPEDLSSFFVRPVQDVGSTVQLDDWWRENPQEPSGQGDDQRHIRVLSDVPSLLEVPPGHDIDH